VQQAQVLPQLVRACTVFESQVATLLLGSGKQQAGPEHITSVRGCTSDLRATTAYRLPQRYDNLPGAACAHFTMPCSPAFESMTHRSEGNA
jgi:hypothetical protein